MQLKPLANTGILVPEICLGTMTFGNQNTESESHNQLDYALEKGIPCWISMEERMACGVGACLACVCKSKDVDSHSHVHNKRVCKDGPVFLSTEVEL